MSFCLHLYDIFFGFGQQLVLEFFGHLHIEELLQSSFDGHSALPVPLLHLVAELISIVKLFDLFEICLVIAVAEERQHGSVGDGGQGILRCPQTLSEPGTMARSTLKLRFTFLKDPSLIEPFLKEPPPQSFAYPSTPFMSILMSMVSSPSSSAKHILRNWSSLSSLTGLFFKYLKE